MLSGQIYTPREYIEHQLTMSDEEKKQREVFFEELFARQQQEAPDALAWEMSA